MKDQFSTDQQADIAVASRIAMSRPEQDGFWDRLALFFEAQREAASEAVEQRQVKTD